MEKSIKLGVSTCLLGDRVRYDGTHQLDRFITDTLGKFVEFVPVCPEVECGFPTPREAFRLIGNPESPRLVTIKTKIDYTDRMVQWARARVKDLEREELCGFVFKARSPSSGMEKVRVYNDQGIPVKKGVGIFARAFKEHFPLLPVEEDGRLHDIVLRENFIERIFVVKRWRECLSEPRGIGNLVDFHTAHKLLILSHSSKHHSAMGRLVAMAKGLPLKELYNQYQRLLMEALSLKTTVKKNVNVLLHILGFFKKQLSKDEKQEMIEIIDHYHQGYVPLIVVITLVNHYVRKYDQSYLKEQYYLNPHPLELQLRNHV